MGKATSAKPKPEAADKDEVMCEQLQYLATHPEDSRYDKIRKVVMGVFK